MTRIFDLEKTDYNLYETALKSAETSTTNNELRAIAINLRYDHRVPTIREKKFRKFYKKAQKETTSTNPIKVAMDDYRWKKLIEPKIPDFCHSTCRSLIADCSNLSGYCCKPFDRNYELVTVLHLNGLRKPLTGANDAVKYSVPEWKKISNDLNIDESDLIKDSMFGEWLNTQLEGKDPHSVEVENFVKIIFKILNKNLKKKRFNIYWVTLWKDFQQYAPTSPTIDGIDADRWNQVVGVKRSPGDWQIVIKYPAKVVDCLYRPTQLDGGYYPQHFPLPRGVQKAVGGHTMDLAPSDNILLPEYIHRQIKFKPQYWVKGLIGQTKKTSGDKSDLEHLRNSHYQKLKNHYDPKNLGNFKDWMPAPF